MFRDLFVKGEVMRERMRRPDGDRSDTEGMLRCVSPRHAAATLIASVYRERRYHSFLLICVTADACQAFVSS